MRTDDLIGALAADNASRGPSIGRSVGLAIALGVAVALLLFLLLLHPRPDFASAIETVRLPLKFVVTLALAATSIPFALKLAQPGIDLTATAAALFAAPLLLAAAVAVELFVVPPSLWLSRLFGRNWLPCLLLIPLLSFGPLVALLAALRRGAPTRPALAGAAAGLASGGLGATIYAMHCTDDSPLFVAVWYGLAVAALASIGAVAGSRLLRW